MKLKKLYRVKTPGKKGICPRVTIVQHEWIVHYDSRVCTKCGRVEERIFDEKGESY